tara:strand:- start:668 stop:3802 length:3135 start_codon:yes stop_codon:yes gene_type:complete
MPVNNSYKIYNASAGSGKTFNLVKEYLILLLTAQNNDAYKNILAITFTNKAVNEMKSRIVNRLIEFSDKEKINKDSALIKEIIKEASLTVDAINIKSTQILKHLLKNYASFEISTIDKFTQRVVRSFSYELNIDAKYEVEIDEEDLLNKAVDRLISKAGEDSELTKIFIDYAFEKTDDNKSWDISLDFRKIAKILVNENSYEIIKGMQKNSIAEFLELKKYLKVLRKNSIDNSITYAQQALSLIKINGIEEKSFSRATLPNHFNKIINQNYQGIYDNQLESTLANGRLYTSKIDQNQKELIDSIQEDLLKIYSEAKASVYRVKLYNNLLNNLTPLSIINAINDELISLKEEENTILISEFNKIINEEIKNQPAPFIYEKIGTKYKNYFIDEFQDTSNLQWENLIPLIENSLSSENASLTISGDAKQSIYRWRGSQVEQFIELINNVNPFNIDPNVIDLPINYRSAKNIVAFNNGFFTHMGSLIFKNEYFKKSYLEASQKMSQNKEGYVNIRLLKHEKNTDEKQLYNDNVLEIINSCLKNGHQLKDLCIITRKRKEGVVIADFLTEKGIDIISSESLLINSSPDVRFIINMINYCVNEDTNSKLELLNYLYDSKAKVGFKDDFIREFIYLDLNTFYKSLEKHKLYFDNNSLAKLSIYEGIEYIINSFNINHESNSYLQFFLDFTLEYSNRFNSSFYEFLNFYEEKKEKLSIVSPSETNAVELMTIHKSKGLEFPIVIYPYADLDIYKEIEPKEWFPIKDQKISNFSHLLMNFNNDVEHYNADCKSIFDLHRSKQEIDNINLLYVTLTRAKNELYIIGSQCFNKNGQENLNLYSGLLINYLKDIQKWSENKQSYHFGSPTKNEKIPQQEDSVIKSEKFICNPRENHGISLMSKSGLIWDTTKEKAIEKGNLIHEIMSHIKSKVDIEITMNQFLDDGIINNDQYKELSSIILSIINHPELKEYYSGDLVSYNEREIIQKSGGNLIPDRIVLNKDNKAIIIDYKSGAPNNYHKKQLNSYEKALKNMGYDTLKKLLLYMEEDTIKVEHC